MLDDLRDHHDGSSIACDVAIVGAGAAGVTRARHLSGHGLAICLLESGGLDFERPTQELAGVVDRDGRVHGYANLYVAGSSVFPTGSWSNPTLTILALAHRLGDHLLQSR